MIEEQFDRCCKFRCVGLDTKIWFGKTHVYKMCIGCVCIGKSVNGLGVYGLCTQVDNVVQSMGTSWVCVKVEVVD